jgi:SulP family sulfate permease
LFAQPINRIDATGVQTFSRLCSVLIHRQITLHISGVKLPVEHVLRNAGELQASSLLKMYRTDGEAIETLKRASEGNE